LYFPQEAQVLKTKLVNNDIQKERKRRLHVNTKSQAQTRRQSKYAKTMNIVAGVLTDSSGVGLGSVALNVEKLTFGKVGSDLVQPCSLD
jgi:hypothetical protein